MEYRLLGSSGTGEDLGGSDRLLEVALTGLHGLGAQVLEGIDDGGESFLGLPFHLLQVGPLDCLAR